MKKEVKFVDGSKREQRWYHKILDFIFPMAKGSFFYHPEFKEPFTLYPATPLRDKNGRQIYLGDLVRRANGIGKHD